jgi:Family of unknown function (DUF6498)
MTCIVRTVSVLVGLVANLIPLYGVLYWQWDTFQLLMLYWMETVIIIFWTVRRIARIPADRLGTVTVYGHLQPANHRTLCGIVTVHAGIFMLAHLLFLWLLFSRDWLRKVNGFASFMNELFLVNGLWLALVFMFVSGWVSYLISAPPTYPQAAEAGPYRGKTGAQGSEANDGSLDPMIRGLFVRIGIMQVAIIAGGAFAKSYRSMAPLLIVIGLKTLVDMGAAILGFLTERMTMSSGDMSIKASRPNPLA